MDEDFERDAGNLEQIPPGRRSTARDCEEVFADPLGLHDSGRPLPRDHGLPNQRQPGRAGLQVANVTAERKLRRDEQTGLLLVDGPDDIPEFASDDEEAEFWETHEFSAAYWERATRGAPCENLEGHVPPERRQRSEHAG